MSEDEQPPHPLRCETCDQKLMGKCPAMKICANSFNDTQAIYKVTAIIGCASHSPAPAREQQSVEAWAIKAPDGHIILNTVSGSMGESWSNKCFPWAVKSQEGYGFRCVRVRITEVQE